MVYARGWEGKPGELQILREERRTDNDKSGIQGALHYAKR
jgi:hypothetical protein